MLKTLKFEPGQTITLFDSSVDSICQGSLKLITNRRFQAQIKMLAITCLFLAILGFSALSLPVAASTLHDRLTNPVPSQVPSFASKFPVYSSDYKLVSDEPKSDEFVLSIPKINLVSSVVPNVDPTSEEDYKAKLLSGGIAHAKGSYLPGEKGGPVYLFSHSTDSVWHIPEFNAKFFSLKDLVVGDIVDIAYQGTNYRYIIDNIEIINGDDLSIIRSSKSDLLLQTCWPPGTDWKRLIVSAKQLY